MAAPVIGSMYGRALATAGDRASWRERGEALARVALPAALLVFAGIELMVLLMMLPDTLAQWWSADTVRPDDSRPMGDWPVFYRAGELAGPRLGVIDHAKERVGLYSPGFGLFFYPFSFFTMATAYRLYLLLGAAAVLGMAYLAQRGVRSPEAKLAVALGVVSLPEMHWALRGGQLTPMLSLAALGGLMLLRTRPRAAGACLAFLSVKPQFAVVPFLHLVATRRWRALGAMIGAAAAVAAAGLIFVGVGLVPVWIGWMLDLGGDSSGDIGIGALAQHHTWRGTLMSAGMLQPHPLLPLDLIVLTLLVTYVAWRRTDASVQVTATALALLLASPYAMFYDWGMLVVAGALMVRARLRVPGLAGMLAMGGYLAAVATQAATAHPWPPLDGVYGHTNGFYWSAPFGMLALLALALFGRREGEADA